LANGPVRTLNKCAGVADRRNLETAHLDDKLSRFSIKLADGEVTALEKASCADCINACQSVGP